MFTSLLLGSSLVSHSPIDRKALVSRHFVELTSMDVTSPLSVGNGEFAYTADVTGLQTFADEYNRTIPLSTMSQWGFHFMPNPKGFSVDKYPLTYKLTNGRKVGYLYYENGKSAPENQEAADYLYNNPGRINLGRIGLNLKSSTGVAAKPADLKDIHQTLNLWTGELISHFLFDGESVDVSTTCHPVRDQVSFSIRSNLIAKGQLSVDLAFPYGSPGFAGSGGDWNHPNAHQTIMTLIGDTRANFDRTLDNEHYHAALAWSKGGQLSKEADHRYRLSAKSNSMEVSATFALDKLPTNMPSVSATQIASASMWNSFWSKGGVVDLSLSKDPRWKELERRIVLSQYLTRIQCCGSTPPQETGLTCNSWFGKFHLEMHWWHAAHFPLWGRSELLVRSLPYYQHILPKAQATAKRQGYEGARWPKCVGPNGEQGPTYLEPFLIWQQPHPISYAELCYRAHPNKKTLAQYQELVFETAKFMASFAAWDPALKQYRIGPPFADAAEVYWADHENQFNPTFEIAQWRSGLETAQKWRERLGLPRVRKWDDVITHLPPLAVKDGLYVSAETATDTFSDPKQSTSHPCILGPLGMLDGSLVDRETMRRTLHKVMEHWDWENTWGWDYPMMAMTAARLGEGNRAIDALMMNYHKNEYLKNGHNPQMGSTLPIYLPGNGGLLYAVALMAAGWDGSSGVAPGFPKDGSWTVRYEGLSKAP